MRRLSLCDSAARCDNAAPCDRASGCADRGSASLEFLVAGDIVRTVAVEPTLENVGVLAIIVLVRTGLSFVLELEITGRWPWQAKPGHDTKPGHDAVRDAQREPSRPTG